LKDHLGDVLPPLVLMINIKTALFYGSKMKMDPKAFDLLLRLADNPSETVTRDNITQASIGLKSIDKYVGQIRQALKKIIDAKKLSVNAVDILHADKGIGLILNLPEKHIRRN
jgi:DNA-binding response OmpR family regulator